MTKFNYSHMASFKRMGEGEGKYTFTGCLSVTHYVTDGHPVISFEEPPINV